MTQRRWPAWLAGGQVDCLVLRSMRGSPSWPSVEVTRQLSAGELIGASATAPTKKKPHAELLFGESMGCNNGVYYRTR